MGHDKRFRVSEIFGPTIQGEGRHAGVPCYFVRFGGCDYRCSWCDTPYAVLPDQVAQLSQMTAEDILCSEDGIAGLQAGPQWVVLSGGNPALLDLEELIALLYKNHLNIMVETQGSVWKDWLAEVTELCISPKPPSSGMLWVPGKFMTAAYQAMFNGSENWAYLKVVVFDEVDYDWAKGVHQQYPEFDFYLSVGNEDPLLPTVGNPNPVVAVGSNDIQFTRKKVLDKSRWLFEKVANDPQMWDVRVMPQLHTLVWGNQRGR